MCKLSCKYILNTGYSTYVAFLYLEYVQNHPIMNAFVQILGEGKSNDTPARTFQERCVIIIVHHVRVACVATTFDYQTLKGKKKFVF